MVAMRHRFMAATWTVAMALVVFGAIVVRCAIVRILGSDINDMLVDVIGVDVMQMTVV